MEEKLDLPLLGLVMIAKDEAHGILDTLRSFAPYVDHWTILDTGSTDGTQALVREALEGLPGELHEEPFVDFSTSRNRALELHGRATVFTIMPDSDDRLADGPALRAFLTAARDDEGMPSAASAAYLINLRRGALSYFLPLVLRTAMGWRYHGRVHEYVGPVSGEGLAQVKIPGAKLVQDTPPQSLAASRRRWARDLDLLTAELAEKPDDPRALFYLAQTHECLGELVSARRAYERRIKVGGWAEETFEARLRRAKVLAALGEPWPEVQQAYLDAHQFDPGRAEPLFKIAEHWYGEQQHALGFLFARRAAELPHPQATLFVDESVYDWGAADLATISGYYLGDASAKTEGRRFARQCVRARPADERCRANWAFYAPSATEQFSGYRPKQIRLLPEAPYVANNPSVLYDEGQWRCVVRTTNYRIVDGRYLTPDDNVIQTRNFLLELDAALEITRCTEMVDRTGVPRSTHPIHGFEDCRLFRHRGRLHCTSTVCDLDLDRAEEGPREIALLEADDDYAVVAATPLRGPWSDRPQKNWMPVVRDGGGSETDLVYAALPRPELDRQATVFRLGGGLSEPELDPRGAEFFGHGRLRGGSQLVRVPGGWLCIVHDVAWPGGNARIYLHRFVCLSESFEVVSMTDPFYFRKRGIEFCAGLARDGDRLVASFGVEDRAAYLGEFDLQSVLEKLSRNFVL